MNEMPGKNPHKSDAQNGYVETENIRPMRFYDYPCYGTASMDTAWPAGVSKNAPEPPL